MKVNMLFHVSLIYVFILQIVSCRNDDIEKKNLDSTSRQKNNNLKMDEIIKTFVDPLHADTFTLSHHPDIISMLESARLEDETNIQETSSSSLEVNFDEITGHSSIPSEFENSTTSYEQSTQLLEHQPSSPQDIPPNLESVEVPSKTIEDESLIDQRKGLEENLNNIPQVKESTILPIMSEKEDVEIEALMEVNNVMISSSQSHLY
jgi:hypothetical protein